MGTQKASDEPLDDLPELEDISDSDDEDNEEITLLLKLQALGHERNTTGTPTTTIPDNGIIDNNPVASSTFERDPPIRLISTHNARVERVWASLSLRCEETVKRDISVPVGILE